MKRFGFDRRLVVKENSDSHDTIAADGGASFSARQILNVCKNPENGTIFLFHMNHPESGTCEGIKALYEELTDRGFAFVKLEDYINTT